MLSLSHFGVYNDSCGCSEKCPIPQNNTYTNSYQIFTIPLLGEEIENYRCNIYSRHCRPAIISQEAVNYYGLTSTLDLNQLIGKEVRIIRRKVDEKTGQKIDNEYHVPLTKIKEISYYENIQEIRCLIVKVEGDDSSINITRIILPKLVIEDTLLTK
tara:strand:+ start:297 stop:767 length:471 start_codon:yes stop_codon:yes gene_type:complete